MKKKFLRCTLKQRSLYMKKTPTGSAICLNYVWRIHIKRLTACSLPNSLWCVRSPDSFALMLSHLPSADESLQGSISSGDCFCWETCDTEVWLVFINWSYTGLKWKCFITWSLIELYKQWNRLNPIISLLVSPSVSWMLECLVSAGLWKSGDFYSMT